MRGSFIAVMCSATLMLSCVSDATDDSALVCERFIAKVEACGIASAGHVSCFEPRTSRGRCYARCELGASCGELSGEQCFLEAPDPLFECFIACGRAETSRLDCGAGSDDPRCTPCAEGPGVNPEELCDGYADCVDGSDEAGCPTMTCDNGTLTSERHRCDGVPNCPDASDEAGCAILICENPDDEVPILPPWK